MQYGVWQQQTKRQMPEAIDHVTQHAACYTAEEFQSSSEARQQALLLPSCVFC